MALTGVRREAQMPMAVPGTRSGNFKCRAQQRENAGLDRWLGSLLVSSREMTSLLFPFRRDITRPIPWAPCACLLHITKLDDALGDFIVRVTCPCGASRHIEPEARARLVGRKVTFAALATRMRCSQCGKKVAEVVAVARPRPRGG